MTTGREPPQDPGLPEGFRWSPRSEYIRDELKLDLDGKTVAMLLKTMHGGWFARLECHWPISEPLVTRPCTSFETGVAGCEEWARRHAGRLRREIEMRAREKPRPDGPDE